MGTLRFAHPTAGLPRRFAPRNDVEKRERLIQAVIPGRALARTRDDADVAPRSRDTMCPSCAGTFALKTEGAGNAGCPWHPRPVCKV